MSREILFRGKRVDNKYFIDIDGYNGFYKINIDGVVKSVDRYVNHWRGGLCLKKGTVLKPSLNHKGYSMVNLNVNGIGGLKSVHRLVAEAFIPNPENKPQVNHINGIKTDNSVSNLEWCTAKENVRHAFNNGLNKGSLFGVKGEKHPRNILSDSDVLIIKNMYKNGFKISDIANEYNVSYKTIQRALKKVIGNIHDD